MVAKALGARVIAVDVRDEPLELAKNIGADAVLNASKMADIATAIHDITRHGADVSLDALGSMTTFANSIGSLRKRGCHVQVGLLTYQDKVLAHVINRIISHELVLAGSHGLQAHAYPGLFELIQVGRLDPTRLIDRTVTLDDAPAALASMDDYFGRGITIFTPATI
jgi:alcohol dehydrogenase